MENNLLNRLLITSVAAVAGAYILPGVHVDGVWAAILFAIVLSLLNAFLKPVLVVLTLPATFITFGLFLLVINAIVILVADWLMDSFDVDGFGWALIFSFLLSLASSIFNRKEKQRRD